MYNESLDKKDKRLSLRITEEQHDTIDYVKSNMLKITNTDILIAGVDLLKILYQKCEEEDKSYEELLKALIIRNDINRCLSKPCNLQTDDKKIKKELLNSLNENENHIVTMIHNILG